MFARSAVVAEMSARGMAMCLHPDAPRPLLAAFQGTGAGQP